MKFNKALVTGATSGIGEAMAVLLAEKGLPLVLTGRNEERLKSLQKNLSALVPVEAYPVDLAKRESRQGIGQWIKEKNIDLIINNAGFGLYGEGIALSIDEQLEMVEVNCSAVLEITLNAAKSMSQGVILNVSSTAAFQVFPNLAVYAATKAFVNTLSQSLDFELKGRGIRVLTACPGQVATDFANRAAGHPVQDRTDFLVMTPRYAAEALWKQIIQEKRIHIFDWKYRLGTYLSYLLPSSILAPILQRIISER